MESIGWSIRSLDTYNQESKIICKRVAKKLHNGAVILLHDNREKIPILLEMIIKDCTNKGFSFVSLQQLKSC